MLWLIQRHDGKKEKSWTILWKPNNHSSVQNDWPNVYFQTSVRPSPTPPFAHSKPALPLVYVGETCLMWCYIVEIWDVSNGLEFFSYLLCVFNEILPFLIQFDLGRHTHTHTNLIYATKQEIAGKRQAELSRQLPTRLSKFQLYLWTFVYRIRWSQLGCCLGGNLAYKYKVSQDVLW